jgi:hypothetical protein
MIRKQETRGKVTGSAPRKMPLKDGSQYSRRGYYAKSVSAGQAVIESWNSIFSRCGLPEPRRGRAKCPFHDGDAVTSLAVNDEKGVFYCHVCHASGDKIGFVRKLHNCSFHEALSFLGLDSGHAWRAPKVDTEETRQYKILSNFRQWRRAELTRIGKLICLNNKTIDLAKARLEADPDDQQALFSLSISYPMQTRLTAKHEALLSADFCDHLDVFLASGGDCE